MTDKPEKQEEPQVNEEQVVEEQNEEVVQDHQIYVVIAKYKQVNGGQMSFPAKDEDEARKLAMAMLADHEAVEILKVVEVNRIEEVDAEITEEPDGQVVLDPSQIN